MGYIRVTSSSQLDMGNKIQAIKYMRECTNMGLKEATEWMSMTNMWYYMGGMIALLKVMGEH